MSIKAEQISKTFGTFTALKDVSLTVQTGELVALLGPSGSGKTTLLRIIAGLEQPDEGSGPILFQEQNVANRSVGTREVGFVFQHYALFRHMTVFENVAFGLRVRPAPPATVAQGDQVPRLSTAQARAARSPGRTAIRINSRAASVSVLHLPARWRSSRRCCSWTSHSERSTPRCARNCDSGSAVCTMRFT